MAEVHEVLVEPQVTLFLDQELDEKIRSDVELLVNSDDSDCVQGEILSDEDLIVFSTDDSIEEGTYSEAQGELQLDSDHDSAHDFGSRPKIDSQYQHFDPSQYRCGPAITPLYEGASITLLEAVAQHLLWFTEHPGTSKQALTSILELQHHSILPQGNLLPDCYRSAIDIVNVFLIKPLVFDVCPNDCVLFRGATASLEKCPKCGANRYKPTGKCVPLRHFYYLPIGPRLERTFGTANLAQLIQSHMVSPVTSAMFDVHDSPAWRSAYSDTGTFNGDPRGIALGLCTDGVNPFSHLRCNYSMWPIVLSLLNLPREIRHNFENMLLVGIIPSNDKKEAHSIHPYLEVLVDEMMHLSNATLYDAYKQANFNLKVEILLYILDYPGIGKVFNIHGAGSYKGCLWCDIKGNGSNISCTFY